MLIVCNQTVTCRYFTERGVLRVRDLVDTVTWSSGLTAMSCGPRKLRPACGEKLRSVLCSLTRAKLPVHGPACALSFSDGMHFSPISLGVACAVRWDRHQDTSTWRAFHRLCLPPKDLDFIYTCLWKKPAVGKHVFRIFLSILPTCPIDGAVEDVRLRRVLG